MDFLARLSKLREQLRGMKLGDVGLEKERAALALLALSFFGIVYFLVGLNGPPGWGPVFAALSLCYLTAFVGVAAQWFWARWFATGLGWSGFMVGLMSLVMMGWHPALGIYTGLHALVIGALMGGKMAARYELQTAWRERYGMDEYGVTRLGKAVTRGSASLPTLIMWALAPREGQGLVAQLLPVVAFLLGALGLAAVLRLRTWGLLALGAAVGLVLALATLVPGMAAVSTAGEGLPLGVLWQVLGMPAVALGWTALAFLPVAVPVYRFMTERR